jgi:hypothetical protein
MKKLIISSLIVLIAAGGIVYLQNIRRDRARAAEVEQRLKETEAYAAQQEEKSKLLESELHRSDSLASAHANEVDKLKQQLAGATNQPPSPAPSSTGEDKGAPTPGAKLFKDPQMKAMMKKQQMENVERMAGKIVDADLIAQLGLNPEQAGYLKELLKKKYGPGADLTLELMAGELSDAQMAEMGKQFKQQMAEADGQIKSFLGEDVYKTFEWQEKSQDERARVKDFQKKLSGLGQTLTPEQQDGLLRAMYEERQNFHFKVDYSDPLNYDYEHLHEFFGADNFERYFQEMEQLNGKIAQRADAFLTPEQSAQFKTTQQDQLDKGKVTVRMTNALFGKRKN